MNPVHYGTKILYVTPETHARLKKLGVKGETFNDIITKLLNEKEGKNVSE